jgi:hypothetical protein
VSLDVDDDERRARLQLAEAARDRRLQRGHRRRRVALEEREHAAKLIVHAAAGVAERDGGGRVAVAATAATATPLGPPRRCGVDLGVVFLGDGVRLVLFAGGGIFAGHAVGDVVGTACHRPLDTNWPQP